MQKKGPYATLSAKTVNDKALTFLKTVLNYAVNNGYLEDNPAGKIRAIAQTETATTERLPYTTEDLRKILSTPLFTSFSRKEGTRTHGSTAQLEDYAWIVLLGMFTGARVEEICQLDLDDVATVEGIPGIYIHENREQGRRLKNAASRRRVPLHSRLLELGFLHFVEHRRQQPTASGKLFATLQLGAKGNYSAAFSKWWGRLGKAYGFYSPQKTFHSFRHTFKRRMREAEANLEHVDNLQGHTGIRGASDGYGLDEYGMRYPAHVLQKTLEKLNFDDVYAELEVIRALSVKRYGKE